MENFSQSASATTYLQLQRIAILFPTAFVLFLVFPLGRVTGSRFGFHIVPPHVLGTLAVGPEVLAGDAASMAADTFIKVKN
jgi:hypothetical protein